MAGAFVKRIPHRVVVPIGLHQAQTYRAILEAEFVDVNGKAAMGAKLQKLRQAAACPHSTNLDDFQSPSSSRQRSPPTLSSSTTS